MIKKFEKYKKSPRSWDNIEIGDKLIVGGLKTIIWSAVLCRKFGYNLPSDFPNLLFDKYSIVNVEYIIETGYIVIDDLGAGLKQKIKPEQIIKKLNEEEYKEEVDKMFNIIDEWINNINTRIQTNKYNL